MKPIFLFPLWFVCSVTAQPLESILSPEVFSKAAYALEQQGDPKKGEMLFHDQTKLGCTLCHQVFGREIHKPAPNLFGVGDKFTPTELIRAIERPSASILPGFETTQITTTDDQVIVGVLRSVSAKSGYSITDMGDNTHQIKKEEVAKKELLGLSLMPEGLTAGLSKEEYADLIAFLLDQKTTGLAGLAGKDQPADIVILKNPVTLTRYHHEETEFVAPVFATRLPGTDNELVVIEHQAGKVWRLVKSGPMERKELFLDIGQEKTLEADGLVGIAFHPDYLSNRKYYIKYNATESGQLKTIIEERVADSMRLKDSGRFHRRLIEVDQPAGNHNGGHLTFGPDNYLYTAFGDGGPQKIRMASHKTLVSFSAPCCVSMWIVVPRKNLMVSRLTTPSWPRIREFPRFYRRFGLMGFGSLGSFRLMKSLAIFG